MNEKEHPLPTAEGGSRVLQGSGEAVFVMEPSGQSQDTNLAAAARIGYRPDFRPEDDLAQAIMDAQGRGKS